MDAINDSVLDRSAEIRALVVATQLEAERQDPDSPLVRQARKLIAVRFPGIPLPDPPRADALAPLSPAHVPGPFAGISAADIVPGPYRQHRMQQIAAELSTPGRRGDPKLLAELRRLQGAPQ